MNRYKIEQKILTLAECLTINKDKVEAKLEVNNIKFLPWEEFNETEGWRGDAWIASAIISDENCVKAFNKFNKKLFKIIPKIALISQTYIEYLDQPFLIYKIGNIIAFFRYTRSRQPVGLMFMEKEKEALKLLLQHKKIPEAFYYYWKDATNTLGYSAKILLMCAAIEALTFHNKDLQKRILGEPLYKKIFGKGGIRHRLSHGTYFRVEDFSENYVVSLHNAVIRYFNSEIFHKNLINENVKSPQRHFWGNKEEGKFWIKTRNKGINLNLKDLIEDFKEHEFFKQSSKYEIVYPKKNEIEKY